MDQKDLLDRAAMVLAALRVVLPALAAAIAAGACVYALLSLWMRSGF